MKLTEYLSVYAAFLSTFVLIWNILRARPNYKVDLLTASDEIEGKFVFGVSISIKNHSSSTVHLAHSTILYPSNDSSKFINYLFHIIKYNRFSRAAGWVHSSFNHYDFDDGCPRVLESGQSHDIFVPEEIIEEILKDSPKRNIKVVVVDQLWRRKYSNVLFWRELIKENST